MLSSEEFKNWGKNAVLLAHVTTRIPGKKNDDLLGKKGGRGFPHIVALDSTGEVISKLAGGRDIDGFTKMIDSGKKYIAVSGKAEKSIDDKVFLMGHAIEMGKLDLAGARKQAAELGELSAAQKKAVDAKIFNLEVDAEMPKSRMAQDAYQKFQLEKGKKFAGWMKEGKEPTGDNLYAGFYQFIMAYAESEKDADMFEKCLNKLKAKFDNPRAAKFFEMQQKKLDEMRAAGEDDAGEEDGAGDGEM